MRTSTDNTGTVVLGTVNNCAGGLTPWGTWLQAEENIHGYFRGSKDQQDPYIAETMSRLGIKDSSRRKWEKHHSRFDVDQEPNEAHRFGWVVELDPYDPSSMPVKRTALGRFKHEAATTVVSADGRLVVYMGDDQRFEYVYKFVTHGRYQPGNRAHNSQLLDNGTLYVARFDDDGNGEWMPIVHGYGPLTAANGFADQGDVLIRTRQAADALGATPMDRPEDVEASPVSGKVYIACTNNSKRKSDDLNGPNTRGPNRHGHVVELSELMDDATATRFSWNVFLTCGPHDADGADYQGHAEASPISCPDNVAFDRQGNLWISTDGQPKSGANDAVYLVPTTGSERGLSRQFLSAVPGSEVCGPCFTPDQTTFFCAIQHPGDTDDATWAAPGTRWPDYQDGVPPRPSVIAVTRDGGEPIV